MTAFPCLCGVSPGFTPNDPPQKKRILRKNATCLIFSWMYQLVASRVGGCAQGWTGGHADGRSRQSTPVMGLPRRVICVSC